MASAAAAQPDLLDHAGRRGVLTDRNGCNMGLVRYYRWQGWRVVRAVPHPRKRGVIVWSLGRPAEPQPQLAGFVTEIDGASRHSVDPGRRRAAIAKLLTVTVLPIRRGRGPDGSYFDPHGIKTDWKPLR